jgi:Dyp-type peroxidase family
MGINPALPRYQAMLLNLQGNILKSHGRDNVCLLLLQFTADVVAVRGWMKRWAEAGGVTSARAQFDDTLQLKQGGGSGAPFGNFFLSAAGYQALEVASADLLRAFPEHLGRVRAPFTAGMEAAGPALGDPPAAAWDDAYRGQKVHAMVLLADADGARLEQTRAGVERDLAGIARVLARELGTVRRSGNQATEPFGFADGLSQPLFLGQDLADEAGNGGIASWNPAAPLDLALLEDPFAAPLQDCYGSFLVLRKLEQDVKGFTVRVAQLASQATGGDQALAGALVVGRFADGTPVLLSGTPLGGGANNFEYGADPEGAKCPVQAHIRKTNPRGGAVAAGIATDLADERTHRIVRRGIPYGGQGSSVQGEGLLFMCFQSDIANQFAFLQRIWANDPDFSRNGTGVDPTIGRAPAGANAASQPWPSGWGGKQTIRFDFRDFVTLKGGEFFFAPSLAFLAAGGGRPEIKTT